MRPAVMSPQALNVLWISDFPVEWLSDVPDALRALPRRHPATWQMVLLSQFERYPGLRLNVLSLRQRIHRSFSFERNGITFHIVKAPNWLRVGTLFWADTLLVRRFCRRLQPDLVHAWGIEKGAALIATRLRRPCLATIQGLFGWYKELVPLPAYFRFIERLERTSLRRLRLVTTESNFALNFLAQHYPTLQTHQAEHAPAREFFGVRRQPESQPVHFISVGGLSFRKGTDLLFQALDQLAPELDFKLTVISGPEKAYLKSLGISQKLWERVHFKEHLLPDQVAHELGRATLLLLPTRADVSPNAAKEAVVAGVPVITSNVGGLPDYVQPGQNGLLFLPGELKAFVESIRAAVRHPLFSRGQVTSESLAHNRDYLSPERMAKNFRAAYTRALQIR